MPDMTDYDPSPQVAAAITTWRKAQDTEAEARTAVRSAIAEDLKDSKNKDVTAEAAAAKLPWSDETIRGIAREYGVPRKRKPTVKSIKPKKRTAGGKPSG